MQSTPEERADQWRKDRNNVGHSSLCMWLHLYPKLCPECDVVHQTSHPYDTSDFGRCYHLLEAVPEWKAKLYIMRSVSPKWAYLINNWTELTALFKAEKYKECYTLMNADKAK